MWSLPGGHGSSTAPAPPAPVPRNPRMHLVRHQRRHPLSEGLRSLGEPSTLRPSRPWLDLQATHKGRDCLRVLKLAQLPRRRYTRPRITARQQLDEEIDLALSCRMARRKARGEALPIVGGHPLGATSMRRSLSIAQGHSGTLAQARVRCLPHAVGRTSSRARAAFTAADSVTMS